MFGVSMTKHDRSNQPSLRVVHDARVHQSIRITADEMIGRYADEVLQTRGGSDEIKTKMKAIKSHFRDPWIDWEGLMVCFTSH